MIQGTLMRSTIHLVSAADYWPLATAVRETRRESGLAGAHRRGERGPAMEAAAARLRAPSRAARRCGARRSTR